MNIDELIERAHEADEVEVLETSLVEDMADALKAQQVVIEQMLEAVKNSTEHWNGHPEYERVASLQPDLTALREHDAEVILKFAKWTGPIRADIAAFRYIERIRKGEV